MNAAADTTTAKQISLNNALTFDYIEYADHEEIIRLWDAIVNFMDDDTREQTERDVGPCSEIEFLTRYLELADHDLCIG